MTDQPTWPTPDQTPDPQQPGFAAIPPAAPQQPAPGQPMPYQTGSPVPQTSGNAIIALVLAIASWVVCPIVLAIVALVFASKADREIAANPMLVTGSGVTTAAKVVAWINIGIAAAFLVIGIIVLIVIGVAGGMSN